MIYISAGNFNDSPSWPTNNANKQWEILNACENKHIGKNTDNSDFWKIEFHVVN